MRQKRVELDVVSYSAVASACAKGKRWHEALVLLSGLHQLSLQTDAILHKAAISVGEGSETGPGVLNLFGKAIRTVGTVG